MLFVPMLFDRPDAGGLRQRVHPEHKAGLAQVSSRIAFASPLLADDAAR